MHKRNLLIVLALLAVVVISLAPVVAQEEPGFVQWDWAKFSADFWQEDLPDPLTLTPPPTYGGDLPALPVDLTDVRFADKLTDEQRAMLAENGFVVVPAGQDWFDEAYMWGEGWLSEEGTGWFVTTDSFLHTLHYIFDNVLADLERAMLYTRLSNVVSTSLETARQQAADAAGTALETAANNAVTFLSVADQLFKGEMTASDPAEQAIIQQALAGEGQVNVPFLGERYMEDFSQYRPRGHYAGDETLERYFRGMMWLSRVTFLAKDETATQTALLVLRALRNAGDAYQQWQEANDVINFLIGNADDLGPKEYYPIADAVFGAELSLDALADSAKLADFLAQMGQLPGPRINGLLLPPDTAAGNVSEESRGFRLMGQRFTVDANVMQQLMDPYVGGRMLPSALDVAAAMGSETAKNLAETQGAQEFPQYADNLAEQREAVSAITQDEWLQTIYGAWLWTLDPLWNRDPQNLPAWMPPLMRTEAWTLKDLHTGLGSYTELKHDTVLYAKPPGGLGGGGELFSYGFVEPNPVVFARIAVVATMTYEGLKARGLAEFEVNEFPEYNEQEGTFSDAPLFNLQMSVGQLPILAQFSAYMAQLADMELRGEALSENDLMSLQGIGSFLSGVRVLLQDPANPEPVALVTDIASAPMLGQVLQEGVGAVDHIYVVVPHPQGGLQMVRGGVFSYYEFVGDINARMTDDEWRAKVEAGDLPPRPDWTGAFLADSP